MVDETLYIELYFDKFIFINNCLKELSTVLLTKVERIINLSLQMTNVSTSKLHIFHFNPLLMI